MPTVIETTVYTYEGLSDSAKDKARDWYSYSSADDFQFQVESTIDDIKTIGALMGITVDSIDYEVGSDLGTDYAHVIGDYRYKPGGVLLVKEYAPQDTELHRIVKGLQDIQRRYFYSLYASMTSRYGAYGSSTLYVEVSDNRDSYRELPQDVTDTVTELLTGFSHWAYEQLMGTWEYVTSEEYITEQIIANEYTFTADGKREG